MIRKISSAAAIAASIVLLGACQTLAPQAPDYVTNAAEVVKATDWSKMETVTVTIDEHSYAPQKLVFKAGQPYKLQLKNAGQKDHYFTAPEFYKSIATRKAMVNKYAEIKAPYFDAFEILKTSGQIDLYFVPVVKGTYKSYCTIEDHRDKGMEGMIIVE